MTHSCVWPETQSYRWHDSFIYVRDLRFYMLCVKLNMLCVQYDILVSLTIHSCMIYQRYSSRDSIWHVIWYINHTRHVTHSYLRTTHDSICCVCIYIYMYISYIYVYILYICVCVCVHWIEYVVRSDCCALNHSVTRAVEACNVYFCTNEPNISAKEPHITSKEPWDVQFNVMRVQVASKRGGWAAGAHKRALYLHKKARHRRKKALYFRKRVRISTKEPYISAKSPVSPQKALRRTIQCDVRATRAHVASSWHWIARLRALLTWYRALLRKSAVDEPQEGAKEPCISTKSTETYDSMWCACNLRTNAVEEP